MDWDYSDHWTTREKAVASGVDFGRRGWKILARVDAGGLLWTAYKLQGDTFVWLDIIEREGVGHRIKSLGEDQGPCFYNCPMSIIAAAGPTTNPGALRWRQRVARYLAEGT